MKPVRRFAALLASALLAAALSACSGTSTPLTPILYLVFQEPTGQPARIALISFTSELEQRRIELVTANAFSFAADDRLLAIDVRGRGEPSEVWVLSASRTAPRATALHRFSLIGIPDAPGTTLSPLGPPLALTLPDGSWAAPFIPASAFPSGCLSDLVVAASGTELLLIDEGASGRCGALAAGDPGDRQVHHLSLISNSVRVRVTEPLPPSARPGVLGSEAFLVSRPPTGSEARLQLAGLAPGSSVRFDALVPNLRDVSALRSGVAVMLDRAGTRLVELRPVGEEGEAIERRALAAATRLYVRDEGGGVAVLTHSANRIGIDYPNRDALREIPFGVVDVTLDPNAYAVALSSSTLCFIDLLVPSDSGSCDFRPPNSLAFSGGRFIAWAYAAPSAP